MPMNVLTTLSVVIRDPNGDIVDDGTNGYELLSSDFRRFQALYPSGNLPTGSWKVEVSGNGYFSLDLYASSTLHLAYPGRHTLPVGRSVPLRAALINEAGDPSLIDTANFFLVSMDGQQELPINLFDDGQHGDGAAGDGVYGGSVLRDQQGCQMLMVRGTLKDGTSFTRMYPAPIRFRAFDLDDPTSVMAVPGTLRTVNFSLENESASNGGQTMTFDLEAFSDQGWAITNNVPDSVTLQPGESVKIPVSVQVPSDTPAGTTDSVVLVAAPTIDIGLSTSATAVVDIVDSVELFLPFIMRP